MEKLRHIREQAGYSQQELSNESGVSQHTISEIELGRRKPQGRTLRKLARVLGVQVSDFFEGTGRPKGGGPPPPQRSLFNHLAEERRRAARDLRIKHNIPADALQWTAPKEITLAKELLEWRHARRVVSWVEDVRALLQVGRMSLADAVQNFFEAAAVLEGIVAAMPLGHANTGAPQRIETEAVRDAFLAYIATIDEVFSDVFALKALPPEHLEQLQSIANRSIPNIGFGLGLRGVAVSEEGRQQEELERAKAFQERVSA